MRILIKLNSSKKKVIIKPSTTKKRKLGKVSYVSIFNSAEQERIFADSARNTMSKEAKLEW